MIQKDFGIVLFVVFFAVIGLTSETYSQNEQVHEVIRLENIAGISDEDYPVKIDLPNYHSINEITVNIEFKDSPEAPFIYSFSPINDVDSIDLKFKGMIFVFEKIDNQKNKTRGVSVNILGVKNSKDFNWYRAEKLKKRFSKKGAWIIKSLIIKSDKKPSWFDSKIGLEQYPKYQVKNLLLDVYQELKVSLRSGFRHKLSVNTSIFLPDFGDAKSFRVKRMSYSDNCSDLAVAYLGEERIGTSSESPFLLQQDEGKSEIRLRIFSVISDEVNSSCTPDLRIAFTVPKSAPIVVGSEDEIKWQDYPELDSELLKQELIFDLDTIVSQLSPLIQGPVVENICRSCNLNGSAQLAVVPSVWEYKVKKIRKRIDLSDTGSEHIVQNADTIIVSSWKKTDKVHGRFLNENLVLDEDANKRNRKIKELGNGIFFIDGLDACSYIFQSYTLHDPVFKLIDTIWVKGRKPSSEMGVAHASENLEKLTNISLLDSLYIKKGNKMELFRPYMRRARKDSSQKIIGYSNLQVDFIYVKGSLPEFKQESPYRGISEWGVRENENGEPSWNKELFFMSQDENPKEVLTTPLNILANTNCQSEYILVVDPQINHACLSKLRYPDPTVL
ncbi:MAG: hypothetical protein AAFN93_14305, partial [Bacteroidota bacterium]